ASRDDGCKPPPGDPMQSASSFLRRKLNVATWLVAASLCAVALPAQAEKVLNWGTGADVDSMDVHVAGTVNSWQMFEMVYETLLTTDKDMQLRPGLAESWKQTPPTTYVLTLRKDAQWSNGRPVVAADVIGTFERIKGMEMNPAGVASAKTEEEKKKASRKISSYWSRQLGSIKSMTATNDRAVQVELDRPQTAFLPALAHI